jgi:hypothetical protein
MGRKSAVNMGRNILAEEIDKVEAIFKAKIHAVDSREVVFPTSKTQPSAGLASHPCESLDDVFWEPPKPHFGEHQAGKTKIECDWVALLENGTSWKIKTEADFDKHAILRRCVWMKNEGTADVFVTTKIMTPF